MKVKSPQNFVSMAKTLRSVDGDTDIANNTDTELWLVQVPLGFQVSALNKLESSVLGASGGTQTLKVKTEQENKVYYSVTAFRDSDECQRMSTVVASTSGEISLGGKVRNMLMVTEMAARSVWHADSTLPAQRKPVPMPEGLKVRHTPFGAGTPCPSVSGKSRKRKKRASKADKSAEEAVCHSQSSSKKRKREASPDSCEEPSPKKKKKKSKHRHSDSMDIQNGDDESTAQFVIDTTGDPSLTAEDNDGLQNHPTEPDRTTKHKKSKKGKKHRKTM